MYRLDLPKRPRSQLINKSCFSTVAAVVVWDSQVRDGYKRSKAPAANGSAAGAWDGRRASGVVEELLRNATDKAYGTSGEILTGVYSCVVLKSSVNELTGAVCPN